jgi:hypothetical protein
VDPDGAVVMRCTFAHTGAGLRTLVKALQRAEVDAVGIERPDGPVVDALLEAGFTVFVVARNQLKNLRSRYGSAGNKDDRFDAYVLADTVRTDRHRLTARTQDGSQTVTLRMTVRARRDLIAARVAMANQLRAHLQSTLPGAIGLFCDIDSAITLAFLTRFPSQPKADWLSPARPPAGVAALGRATRRPPRRPHLHLAATRRPRARPACSPRSVTPAAATPSQSLWSASPAQPLDPSVRQGQSRLVPLGCRQATARRRH